MSEARVNIARAIIGTVLTAGAGLLLSAAWNWHADQAARLRAVEDELLTLRKDYEGTNEDVGAVVLRMNRLHP